MNTYFGMLEHANTTPMGVVRTQQRKSLARGATYTSSCCGRAKVKHLVFQKHIPLKTSTFEEMQRSQGPEKSTAQVVFSRLWKSEESTVRSLGLLDQHIFAKHNQARNLCMGLIGNRIDIPIISMKYFSTRGGSQKLSFEEASIFALIA